MDTLTIILRTIRREIEATGVPPDSLQDALTRAERTVRGSLGGGFHLITRAPDPSTAERIAQLAPALSTKQISERLGVSDRHVRRVIAMLRR
jgi:AraC-like DNA-binding protein